MFSPDDERGGQKTERLRVIDWEQPANNDFLLVSQFSVTGALYTCRPDLVGFVNGLPLVVIELKKPRARARGVRREPDALQDTIPQLFWSTRCSSPRTARTAGSAASRRIGSSSSSGRGSSARASRARSLETMIRGTCEPDAPARPGGEFHPVSRGQRPGW